MSDVAAAAVAPVSSASAPPAAPSSVQLGHSMWAHGSFSFKDLLDIVNPLQHLPVIGSIYRYLTGDEPAAGTRVIGDTLYGGPIGLGVSVVSTALLTDADGRDLGERLLADVFGSRDHDAQPTLGAPRVATADGQPATPPSASLPGAIQQAPAARPALALPQSSPQGLAAMPAQPVAMNDLFHSAPQAQATPEQRFMAQASQFQRQISQGRGTNGAVLNNHPVPLELSSNLLPVMPAGGHLSLGPGVAAPAGQATAPAAAGQASAAKPMAGDAPSQNPIAQKMLDALNKYEQLKKQEEQQDNAAQADQAKLDLSL